MAAFRCARPAPPSDTDGGAADSDSGGPNFEAASEDATVVETLDPSGLIILDPSKPAMVVPEGPAPLPAAEVPFATQGPFRGPAPFGEVDATVFFGRDVESDHLTRLLLGPQARALVLVGERGIGKTSLLKSGVLSAARQQGVCAIYLNQYHGAINEICRVVSHETGFAKPKEEPPALFLLRVAMKTGILILCDDAHLLVSEATSVTDRFDLLEAAKEISESNAKPPPRIGMIFALDDISRYHSEALAADVPELGRHDRRFRIGRFDASSAAEVIRRSAGASGTAMDNAFTQALAEDLVADGPILPLHLQLACFTAMARKVRRLETLQNMGGGRAMLYGYFHLMAGQTPHPEVARDVLLALATPDGHPKEVTYDDLLALHVGEPEQLGEVGRGLEAGGVIRSLNVGGKLRFRFTHPALAPLAARSLGRSAEAQWRSMALWGQKLSAGEKLTRTDLSELRRLGDRPRDAASKDLYQRSVRSLALKRLARWLAAAASVVAVIAYLVLSSHVRIESFGDRDELMVVRGPSWLPISGDVLARTGMEAPPEGSEGRDAFPGFGAVGPGSAHTAATRLLEGGLPGAAGVLVAHHLSGTGLKELLEAAETDDDKRGAIAALAAAGAPSEAWAAVIEAGLESESVAVQRSAAAAIAAAPEAVALRLVKKALDADDAGVRIAAARVLSRLGEVDGWVDALRRAVADGEPSVRSLAVRAAAAAPDDSAGETATAVAVAVTDPVPEVRDAALVALSTLASSAPKEVMATLAAALRPEMAAAAEGAASAPAPDEDGEREDEDEDAAEESAPEVLLLTEEAKQSVLGLLLELAEQPATASTAPFLDALAKDKRVVLETRLRAVRVLGALAARGHAEALDRLEALARSFSPVRGEAVVAFVSAARADAPRALSVSAEALESTTLPVRFAAVRALGSARGTADVAGALTQLENALRKFTFDARFKERVAAAVGEMGEGPRTLGLLIRLSKDDTTIVRLAAINGLANGESRGKKAPRAAVATLVGIVRAPKTDSDRVAALAGLRRLAAMGATVEFAAIAASRIGTGSARAEAARLLAGTRARAAADVVRKLLEDRDPTVRAAAAWSLGRSSADTAAAAVRALARSLLDEDPVVWRATAEALGELGAGARDEPVRAGALQALRGAFTGAEPENRSVLAAAVRRIATISEPSDVAVQAGGRLVRLLRDDPDPTVRTSAARALREVEKLPESGAAALFEAFVLGETVALRDAARGTIAKHATRDRGELAGALGIALGAATRHRNMIFALVDLAAELGVTDTPQIQDALVRLATHPEPAVRAISVAALAADTESEQVAAALERARHDVAAIVRDEAEVVFGLRAATEPMDKLVERLSSPDPSGRLQAMVAIHAAVRAGGDEVHNEALDLLTAMRDEPGAPPLTRLAAALTRDALDVPTADALAYWRAILAGDVARLRGS